MEQSFLVVGQGPKRNRLSCKFPKKIRNMKYENRKTTEQGNKLTDGTWFKKYMFLQLPMDNLLLHSTENQIFLPIMDKHKDHPEKIDTAVFLISCMALACILLLVWRSLHLPP